MVLKNFNFHGSYINAVFNVLTAADKNYYIPILNICKTKQQKNIVYEKSFYVYL